MLSSDTGEIVSERLWERPEVCRVGTLKGRLTATCGVEPRPPCRWESSAQAMALTEFDFDLFANPYDAFAAIDSARTRRIRVPGPWQLAPGVDDRPVYTNIRYPIEISHPPRMPVDNPAAVYSRTVPRRKDGGRRRAVLHVGAADSCAYVRIDRKWVAFWKDSRLPAEVDVPDGEGDDVLLQILVIKWSDGSYLEDQDAWSFSGLIRDVYLLFPPKSSSIFDLWWAVTDNMCLEVHVEIEREEEERAGRIEITVEETGEVPIVSEDNEEAGRVVGSCSINMRRKDQDREEIVAIISGVDSWKFWSAENPFLYTVRARLVLNDEVVQCESVYAARRDIEIVDGVLKVNRRRLVVAGVNRHETCPRRGGPSVSRVDAENDVVLLKKGNFNAVRTAHYPHSPAFLAACDRGGLYVVDEANIETHGMSPYPGYLADHASWRQAFHERFTRMILRDRSHPSIFAWSLGNEAGYGKWHKELAAESRRIDPSRLVHYEPATWDASSCTEATDLLCPMYARIRECETLLEKRPDLPLVLCEYCHAMGNSCGNLDKYWNAFLTEPRLQGGFIWDMCDQGVVVNHAGDDASSSFWGYGGDFGELPTDGTFCVNGLLLPDRSPKPTWYEAVAAQRPFGDLEMVGADVHIRKVRVEDLDFSWSVTINGVEIASESAAALTTRGKRSNEEQLLDFYEPYVLRIDMSQHRRTSGQQECWLSVTGHLPYDRPWAPKGFEVGTAELEISTYVPVAGDDERNASPRESSKKRLSVEVDPVTSLPMRALCSERQQDLLSSSSSSSGQSSEVAVFLDNLVLETEVGYGDLGTRGRLGYEGKRVTVAGRTCWGRSLSAHANSRLTIDLSRAAIQEACGREARRLTRLKVSAALNDDAEQIPLVFSIHCNGKIVFTNEAEPLSKRGEIREIDVDAEPMFGHAIQLVVESMWGTVHKAHAVWLDPAVYCETSCAGDSDDSHRYSRGPVRLCFERAPTDNDRGGYLTFWQAAGLHEPLFLESAVKQEDGWSMLTLRPRNVDVALLRLAAKLDDRFLRHNDWEGRLKSPKLKKFAHAYAAANRFAHAESSSESIVRIWRLEVVPCTTHSSGQAVSAAQADSVAASTDEGEDDEFLPFVDDAPLCTKCRVRTIVSDDGFEVQVANLMFLSSSPHVRWPRTLPRIGIVVKLAPGSIGRCRWLGRGPGETYPDRKLAGGHGLFSVTNLDLLHTPYLRPSTCGNRTDTRRVFLDSGLEIDSEKPFDFSLTKFSTTELSRAAHQHELLLDPGDDLRDVLYLHLDAEMMGVGGDDSWTACVHDEFLVKPPTTKDPFAFAFRFRASSYK